MIKNNLPIDSNANMVPLMNIGMDIDPIVINGIGASAATTDPIDAKNNTIVRLYSNRMCYIAVGEEPVATEDSHPMEYYWEIVVPSGAKIAVLGAKLWISIHQEV